ncbi:MAG: RNA chaperone Hfq [Rickettsiales bacterium]|nr:RNA chaperone Hfq [Rickettsiales bacterium]
MADKGQNMQDVFLNNCRKDKKAVTVYLVNGVKLQGVISGFDNFSVVLKRNQMAQLIYKHSIATVVPSGPLSLSRSEEDDESEEMDESEPLLVA